MSMAVRLKCIVLIGLLMFVGLLMFFPGAAAAADTPDQAAVRKVLMDTYDTPQSHLVVDPVVTGADQALAGWTQGQRGGVAMFTRKPGGWQLSLCGNDMVTQADNLVLTGMTPADAQALSEAFTAAARREPPERRALFRTFGETVRME